jgi:hypothetical protein
VIRFSNPLDNIRIASPCNADWDQMIGNDRARFCGQCNLNVYNLSSMMKVEAELLIGRTEGRLCVRYFRRADGSVMTQDCPVGLRAIRRRMSYVARAVSSAVLSFFAGLGFYEITRDSPLFSGTVMGAMPVPTRSLHVLEDRPVPVEQLMGTVPVPMGKVVFSPPKPPVRKRAGISQRLRR